MLPESFTTERLWVRRPRLTDAPAIFEAYAADPEVTKYLTWRPHLNVDSVAHYLEKPIAEWEVRTNFRYEMCLRGTDTPIGALQVQPETAGHGRATQYMLGYVLGRAHWGKGLTVEAVRFVVNKVLELEGVYRAYACCDVENIASARVMEKAGLEKEGTLRRYVTCPNLGSIPRDCHLYAKVKL